MAVMSSPCQKALPPSCTPFPGHVPASFLTPVHAPSRESPKTRAHASAPALPRAQVQPKEKLPTPFGDKKRSLALPVLFALSLVTGSIAVAQTLPTAPGNLPASPANSFVLHLTSAEFLPGLPLSGYIQSPEPAAQGHSGTDSGLTALPGQAQSLRLSRQTSGTSAPITLYTYPRPFPGSRPGADRYLLPLPSTLIPGKYRLDLLNESGTPLASAEFLLAAREFIKETIPLDAANTKLRTSQDPAKEAEWLVIKKLYDTVNPDTAWFSGSFGLPAGPARRTAFFGDQRIYQYSTGKTDRSIHSGIDFALPVGTSIRAPGGGRVVFTASRIVTGKTLVLEHLPGLYSVYMHLSEFSVSPGTMVARGDQIAKSGNTGLSTGPHLHWEIRLGGESVDPDWFLASGSTLK